MLDNSHYGKERLRRGFLSFVLGRGVTGLLGIGILMMQVRLLSLSDYGAYVAFFAVFELTLAVSTFGIDWVGLRFIPDYRANGGLAIRHFFRQLCSARLVTLLAAMAAWFFAIMPSLAYLGLSGYEAAFAVFGLLVLTEGMLRFVVCVLLESLLAQIQAQTVMAARSLSYSAFLLAAALGSEAPQLTDVVRWEMIASSVGLVVAFLLLFRFVYRESDTAVVGWTPPERKQMMHLGFHMYLSLLLAQLSSSLVFMVLSTRLLGLEMAALYGFARNIGEIVRKFLPAQLLRSLIRPVVLARYNQSHNFLQLNRQVGYAYLASLLALLPLLVAFGLAGNELAALLSAGKFTDSRWLIFAILTTFIPFSHRIVLELVITAVERADLWTRAALMGVLSLPLAIALTTWTNLGAYALVLVVFLVEMLSNYIIVTGLRSAGYAYSFDWPRLLRLSIVGLFGILAFMPFEPPSTVGLVAKVSLGLTLTVLLAWKLRLVSAAEFALVRQFLPQPK